MKMDLSNALGNITSLNRFDQGVEAEQKRLLNKINSYSSASSRASNEYERGISVGIEKFREYLLSDKKRIIKK